MGLNLRNVNTNKRNNYKIKESFNIHLKPMRGITKYLIKLTFLE